MNWIVRLATLLLLAIPAFSGYPLTAWPGDIVTGVAWAWAAYLLAVHLAIRSLCGARIYANLVAVAALVSLPVVFAGGSLNWIGSRLGWSTAMAPTMAGSHYVQLCITMLTVVPLSLAMVSVIPFGLIERRILVGGRGVGGITRRLLMALRVFNHITFFVMPALMEVMREQRPDRRPATFSPNGDNCGTRSHRPGCTARCRRLIATMVYLGVEGICASVQYIPMWAVEIARLPDRGRSGKTDEDS